VSFLALKIRLKRVGAHKRPFFRIVVADSRSPQGGKFIEKLGTYDPLKEEEKFNINLERSDYWIKNGAQPTEVVGVYLAKLKK
jgi:small subunit ribosomal protein S16